MADRLLVSQTLAQVEAVEASKLKVAQVVVQVEFVEPEPGTFYGSLQVSLSLASQSSQDFVYEGNIGLSLGFASLYYQQAEGEYVYEGNLPIALTPSCLSALGYAYVGGLVLSLVPTSESVGPVAYEGDIRITLEFISIYRMPVSGFDYDTGYGLINIEFLSESPPYYVIEETIPLALTLASVLALYREFSQVASGGLGVAGEGTFGTSKPPSFDVVGWGGVNVAGIGTKVFGKPGHLDVVASGGAAVSGSGTFAFTGFEEAELPSFELVGSGGVDVAGRGATTFVRPETFSAVASGGAEVSGKGVAAFTGVEAPTIPVFAIVGSGGAEVNGEGEYVVALPGVPLAVVGIGGIEIDGSGILIVEVPHAWAVVGSGGVAVGGGTAPTLKYETWVFVGETFEPALYSGHPFNSYAKMGDSYYGAGEDGIYLLEGDTDDGQVIRPGVVLGPFHLGAQATNRIRTIYLGEDCDGAEVKVEGGETGYYTVEDGKAKCGCNVMGKVLRVSISDFEELPMVEMAVAQRGHG